MAKAKAMSDWDHTTALRCDVLNSAFGRKKMVAVRDLHPLRKAKQNPSKPLDKAAGARLLDRVFGM